jgi:branched-chain amino acid transport system ATP-binding protein
VTPSGGPQLGKSAGPQRGNPAIVVEHDMPLIMQACDRILVMSFGKRIALGTPLDIRSDQTVIDAYLGTEYDFA